MRLSMCAETKAHSELKRNLSNCLKIWIVASLTYEQQKTFLRIAYFQIFSLRVRFLRDHHTFFNLITKMFCKIHCSQIWQNGYTFFQLFGS